MTVGCMKAVVAVVAGVSALALSALPAAAQPFYQGKTIEIIQPAAAGDSYDTLSRLFGRHMGRHLPGNPAFIVRSMPGGGGIVAVNHLFNIAPKDGTVLGMMDQSIFETQLFTPGSLKADVRRMTWIGRAISNNAGLYGWHTAPVQKIQDAFSKELIVSSTGRASQIRWTMLKNLIGVKFKLITGHKGASEGLLAMERGEVDAVSMPWVVFRVIRAQWLAEKKVNVLLQTGVDGAPDLPGVPRMIDLARNGEERMILELFSQAEKVGRSFSGPPGMPAERVAELRSAYAATLTDPAFLADAKTMNVTLDPMPGEAMQTMISKFFDHPPALVAKALALTKAEKRSMRRREQT
jgi:tripartite-type tricarboxylate transporter receptor subunit TctC